jgi:D-3-phosphoglycerate dehydrogenase
MHSSQPNRDSGHIFFLIELLTMNNRPTVVIPGDDPPMVRLSPYLESLYEIAEVILYPDRPDDDEEKVRRVSQADIVLNSRSIVKFPASILRQLPRLKMIAVCGIGFDAIDVSAAKEQGIVVCNVPGRTATVVAEHAIGLMLAVARRMAWQTMELKSGRWRGDHGISLIGKQIGVIGTGHIGCEMIRLCRAFGMNVVAWTLNPDPQKATRLGFRYVPLRELLESSDVVSLHTRLSDQTRHLIGHSELLLMKPQAILINTARGAVVDTSALIDALDSGRLFGAGVDVFEQEPLPFDSPLLKCQQVVLTAHTADQTQEGVDLLTQGCIDNIREFLAGRPTNRV